MASACSSEESEIPSLPLHSANPFLAFEFLAFLLPRGNFHQPLFPIADNSPRSTCLQPFLRVALKEKVAPSRPGRSGLTPSHGGQVGSKGVRCSKWDDLHLVCLGAGLLANFAHPGLVNDFISPLLHDFSRQTWRVSNQSRHSHPPGLIPRSFSLSLPTPGAPMSRSRETFGDCSPRKS